jgi:hypothetical protein
LHSPWPPLKSCFAGTSASSTGELEPELTRSDDTDDAAPASQYTVTVASSSSPSSTPTMASSPARRRPVVSDASVPLFLVHFSSASLHPILLVVVIAGVSSLSVHAPKFQPLRRTRTPGSEPVPPHLSLPRCRRASS